MAIGVVLGLRVVEVLFRDYALCEQVMRAVERDLVVGSGSAGFGEILIGLLNFFGARAVFGFSQAGFGAFPRAASLLVQGA